MASNFGKRDEVAERKSLEKGHHLCRKVTAALQREMSRGLTSGSSSSAEPDFTSASAPVIVYSLENHVLDVATRRKLAFKCAACIALCFCLQRVTFRVRYGAAGMRLSVCVMLSHHVCALICLRSLLRAKALPRGPTSCCWSSNESLTPSSSNSHA
jgi:hypothetical protein